jgi:hypothetical protein
MKRLLLIAALALCALPTFAATAPTAITFTRPTTYVDGSALPASAITSYTIACEFTAPGATNATPCTLSTTTIPGQSTTGTLTLTYPGTGGQACFTLRTNVGSVQSNSSSPAACKTLDAIAPSPPTNVTVTVSVALQLSSASPITVVAATPVVTQK